MFTILPQADGALLFFSYNIRGYLNSLDLTDAEKDLSSVEGWESHCFTVITQLKSKYPATGEERFVPYLFTRLGLFQYARQAIERFGPEGKEQSEKSYQAASPGIEIGIELSRVMAPPHSAFFIDVAAKISLTQNQGAVFFPVRFSVLIQSVKKNLFSVKKLLYYSLKGSIK